MSTSTLLLLDKLITNIDNILESKEDNDITSIDIPLSDIESFNESKISSTWVNISSDTHFSILNIPFGVFRKPNGDERIGTRIGDYILNLYKLTKLGLFKNSKYLKNDSCFLENKLNQFMSLSNDAWTEARHIIQYILINKKYENIIKLNNILLSINNVTMLLPCNIGDYTDFYSSEYHATNVGIMFRGKENALQPNWKHLPVGYHGRASSIIVSQQPIRRPYGQINLDRKNPKPFFGKCNKLDIELEVGWFYGGKSNQLGNPIKINDTFSHIFGMVLLNDWSARDIQGWEYIPLGPFNAKNFASSISPWIITIDALQYLKTNMVEQKPELLPYLKSNKNYLFDINLNVKIQSQNMDKPQTISESNTKYLYYSCFQQLTHHTITGCNFKAGDFLGSGTISGPTKGSYGSFLEITWNGKEPIKLNDGSTRKFLEDGDKIILSGSKKLNNGMHIGFGTCESVILPAHNPSLLGI